MNESMELKFKSVEPRHGMTSPRKGTSTRSANDQPRIFQKELLTDRPYTAYPEDAMIGESLEIKKLPSRLKWSKDTKLISREIDEVDPIYNQRDPIEASLLLRKSKGGMITHVIKDYSAKVGKYFFNLRVKPAKKLGNILTETESDKPGLIM